MRVLVTGAGGNLGRVAVPALAAAGHEVRRLDGRPLDGPEEAVVADVRDAAAVRRAVAGVEAVVHAAALHGVHLERWAPADFWSVNATGTFHVLDAMREAGVRRLVLCSTMGVYGDWNTPAGEPWRVFDERSPLRPADVYGLSKVVCETLAEHAARADGVGCVALRLGMFVPETFERYGFRLLFGGVDDRDVAAAVQCALDRTEEAGFDAFDVMAETGFGPGDAAALGRDLPGTLERRYRGTVALLEERGLDLGELVWARALWPVGRARDGLGWEPRHGFAEFLAALRAGDRAHYPFAGLPWWGA